MHLTRIPDSVWEDVRPRDGNYCWFITVVIKPFVRLSWLERALRSIIIIIFLITIYIMWDFHEFLGIVIDKKYMGNEEHHYPYILWK